MIAALKALKLNKRRGTFSVISILLVEAKKCHISNYND